MTNFDDNNQHVTVVFSHLVKPGRETGYEEWMKGISAVAKTFPGHAGVSIFRPEKGPLLQYVIVLKFDRMENLQNWLDSDVRQEWIERSKPLIQPPQELQILTGMETWFTLPTQLGKPAPPRYKMAVITWLGVYSCVMVLGYILKPILGNLPLFLNQAISIAIVVILLTYIIMPRLTKLFSKWLYGS